MMSESSTGHVDCVSVKCVGGGEGRTAVGSGVGWTGVLGKISLVAAWQANVEDRSASVKRISL